MARPAYEVSERMLSQEQAKQDNMGAVEDSATGNRKFDKLGRKQNSRLVAAALAVSWRDNPWEQELSLEELSAVAPLLLSFGAAGLGWWRFRHSDLRDSSPALELHQAYRLHSLQAAIHEREIKAVIPFLQSAGIDPVMVKGWAIARKYP